MTVSNFEIANLKNRVRKNLTGKNDVDVMYGAVRSDPTLSSGRHDTYIHPKILTDGPFEAGLLYGRYCFVGTIVSAKYKLCSRVLIDYSPS